MDDRADAFPVQICYSGKDRVLLKELYVVEGTTLHQAILQSGILELAPDIDLMLCRVGIYGKLKTLDVRLRAFDRIEIYRQLIADPMQSRRARAGKKAGQTAG